MITDYPYYAKGDGIANDKGAIQKALVAESRSGITTVLPRGNYLIDNRRGPLVIPDFSGAIVFEKGACLLFLSPLHGGLWFGDETQFHGGHDIQIEAPCIDYREHVTSRSTESGLVFNGSRNVTVRSAIVRQSPGAGIVFREVHGLTIDSADIHGTLADGVHVANSFNGKIKNIRCDDTGDDCLSFVSYTGGSAGGQHFAKGVVSRHSLASGVSVVGMSDVALEDLDISDTRASGIRVNSDQWTRGFSPRNIRIQNARIANAGQYSSNQGGGSGLELGDGFSTTEVSAQDIQIKNSYRSGVTSGHLGKYHLTRVLVESPNGPYAKDGFELSGAEIVARNLAAKNIPDYCLYLDHVGTAVVEGLELEGCSLTSNLKRAVWADGGGPAVVRDMRLSGGKDRTADIFVGNSGSSAIVFYKTRVFGKQRVRLQSSAPRSGLYFAD